MKFKQYIPILFILILTLSIMPVTANTEILDAREGSLFGELLFSITTFAVGDDNQLLIGDGKFSCNLDNLQSETITLLSSKDILAKSSAQFLKIYRQGKLSQTHQIPPNENLRVLLDPTITYRFELVTCSPVLGECQYGDWDPVQCLSSDGTGIRTRGPGTCTNVPESQLKETSKFAKCLTDGSDSTPAPTTSTTTGSTTLSEFCNINDQCLQRVGDANEPHCFTSKTDCLDSLPFLTPNPYCFSESDNLCKYRPRAFRFGLTDAEKNTCYPTQEQCDISHPFVRDPADLKSLTIRELNILSQGEIDKSVCRDTTECLPRIDGDFKDPVCADPGTLGADLIWTTDFENFFQGKGICFVQLEGEGLPGISAPAELEPGLLQDIGNFVKGFGLFRGTSSTTIGLLVIIGGILLIVLILK